MKGQRERTGGRIDIEFINSEGEPLCSVDITSNRVTLNQHFPFVRDAQGNDNEEALAAVVIMAFVQASVAAGATKVLPNMPAVEAEDRFSEAVTRLLGQMTFRAADASPEAA